MSDEPFLARWAKRKELAREGKAVPAEAPMVPKDEARPAALPVDPANRVETAVADPSSVQSPAPPPPTMDDVAGLTAASDYSRFVGAQVDRGVSNAAMKKLFADPHFNVMDGLDTYIDDYGKPDPIPASALRKMVQSQVLGLFDDEPEAEPPVAAAAPAPVTPPPADDDADLRLQPDDAARRPGAGARPRS